MAPRSAVGLTESTATVRVGSRVRIVADGRVGTVVWEGIDGGCGCRSVIVRLEVAEWWGKRSEVEVVR